MFSVARTAGYTDGIMRHATFGTPFKTRDGYAASLGGMIDLLAKPSEKVANSQAATVVGLA